MVKRGDVMMGWQSNRRQPYVRFHKNRSSNGLQILGIALIVLGLLLLFICIPGWAWAALAGILLVLAGFLLLRLNSGRR